MVFFNCVVDYMKIEKKIKERYMIISITEIDTNYYQIIFARENPFDNMLYKGLLILSIKTNDSWLYYHFKNYGKWLKRKDNSINVLLHLLKTEWKSASQVNFT